MTGTIEDKAREVLAGWYTHAEMPPGMQPWHGGDCPLDPDATVVLFWRDGDCEVERAGDWRWDHIGERLDHEGVADIIGYQPFG